ncbi:hypothetical protein C0991_006106 [Blastosporella zonata]|nr:hypothetical protein C0991_006106 [Blastosporella zonata]
MAESGPVTVSAPTNELKAQSPPSESLSTVTLAQPKKTEGMEAVPKEEGKARDQEAARLRGGCVPCPVFRLPPRWLFVRLETSDGIIGWGEGTLEGHTEAIEGAYKDLIDRFVGANADNIQDIWQTAYRGRFYRGGPVLMARTPLKHRKDIALWDIKGKKLGVPVWQLLGGKVRDRVRVYGWIGGDKPTDTRDAARERKKQGFTAVKMNATSAVAWIDNPSVLDDTITRVKIVRSLGMDVGVDFHGRLHKGMAKQLARLLEPHQPLFIEEPLLPTQPEEIADLARAVSTPIALGERLYTRSEFRPYLERRAIDIAQPDVAHCGGISELHRIAALTETYDVALAPHCPIGPIALAACMQVAISAPNFTIQEMSLNIHYNVSPDPEQSSDLDTYLVNPDVFKVVDGHVAVLDGFFKGTSADQDRRFSDKELKLLKSMKFPPEFEKKVDMRKVNIAVIRPWIAKKIVELVGFEDEVVIEYAMGLLEDQQQPTPDPKKMQINLTGFLTKDTPAFMAALWNLLLEAQVDVAGVPRTFVEEKKAEMRRNRENGTRAIEESDRRFRLDEIRDKAVEGSMMTVEEEQDRETADGVAEEVALLVEALQDAVRAVPHLAVVLVHLAARDRLIPTCANATAPRPLIPDAGLPPEKGTGRFIALVLHLHPGAPVLPHAHLRGPHPLPLVDDHALRHLHHPAIGIVETGDINAIATAPPHVAAVSLPLPARSPHGLQAVPAHVLRRPGAGVASVTRGGALRALHAAEIEARRVTDRKRLHHRLEGGALPLERGDDKGED